MSYTIVEPFEYTDCPEQLVRVTATPVDPVIEQVRQALQALTPRGPGLAKALPRPAADRAASLARRWGRQGYDCFWLDGVRPVPAALNELPPEVPVWLINSAAGVRQLERLLAA